VERFNLKNLSESEVRKECQVKISNRFAVLKNLNDSENVNRICECIKENIKTSVKVSLSVYKLKQHKSCFDEECSRFLDQRKQTKMQWLQDPNRSNVYNLHNVKHEASRHFRTKKEGVWES
jgi:hypothetical protein